MKRMPAHLMGGVILLFGAVLAANTAPADKKVVVEATKTGKTSTTTPPSEKKANGILPGLSVDVKKAVVTATGRICETRGILDFLAVSKGGKTYESVIELDAKPSHLQAALLMIGAEPGNMPPEFVEKMKGIAAVKAAKGKKIGSRFKIYVQWMSEGRKVEVPAEELLFNREKKEAGHDYEWIFTGSAFYRDEKGKEHYMADEEQVIAATWYDVAAVLNLSVPSKNAYEGDTFGFEINTKKVPKKGTPVLVKFVLQKKPKEVEIERNKPGKK